MVYVDFKYYSDSYKGTLPENSFNTVIVKACREIDRNINTRLNNQKISNLSKEAQEELKDTACALIDLLYRKEESLNKKLTSMSIDGVSKSFNILSDTDFQSQRRDIIRNLPYELTCYL